MKKRKRKRSNGPKNYKKIIQDAVMKRLDEKEKGPKLHEYTHFITRNIYSYITSMNNRANEIYILYGGSSTSKETYLPIVERYFKNINFSNYYMVIASEYATLSNQLYLEYKLKRERGKITESDLIKLNDYEETIQKLKDVDRNSIVHNTICDIIDYIV